MSFVSELAITFQAKSASAQAIPMEQYMKNHFRFYGIKTDERRAVLKEVWNQYQEEVKQNSRAIALELFACKEREMHYCAIEILIKNLKKNYQIDDIQLIKKLLITNAWWDTVDTISKYILGEYLIVFPQETTKVVQEFSDADNIWLNRSTLLFQLGYKKSTNAELLFNQCTKHANSKEFFIQKAIGWALREYAKVFPEAVKKFVATANLKPLSNKEALKNIT